ncbi:MAG: ribulose-phosphate 3-epimerase [Lachnospiraceae bacterium]|nr:ribulose-phosphate 3-epimerase [Lachnospiraceae bacterium]MBQ9562687.1 ribulose-phosphate 3-epimerase [Lachnospiraceae bacterium]MBQ9593154.1 ribulose-phosphate 3-epimerase [Lachnospiraceae bacterium]MBR0154050.1 ribulose-phosphate 3-epimerase [Lachnospiraceae bacterium]
MKYTIAPSILAADFTKLGEEVRRAADAGAAYVHLDVMDGAYVPNISFGMPVIASLRKATDAVFDVHMMVREPDHLLEAVKAAGADLITVHAEACTHLHRTIGVIKGMGLKAGVALNPATPLSALDYVLDDVDMVLIMTVNPGFGGQKLIPACYEKIRELRARIEKTGRDIDIEVDGGVDVNSIGRLAEAGANVFVAGTAVFRGNIEENVQKLLAALPKM